MPSACTGDIIAGKYRVERPLGSGGMGYVVAARHIELDQLVAIKFLTKGALADDEEAHARFRLEARSTVRLKSQHIAKVQDVGVHDNDEPYIVMEYLDGVDLGALVRAQTSIPFAEACEYVLQACEGLGEAHAAGIIHRDVKLANLFLTKSASGRPLLKVLDFGVSKSNGEGAALDFTRTEMLLGSPRFMSPEQMNDPRSVDGRTDSWSLGVVLYRLVAGRAPFDGETLGRICSMVLTEEPTPLGSFCPDLPQGLEQVVSRCLAKDRTHRFANVAELASALAPFASDPEASHDRARHIAAMLGVAARPSATVPAMVRPSGGYSSFPPTMLASTIAMVPAPAGSRPREHAGPPSGSFASSHAWSPTITGENAIVAPEPVRERAVNVATLLLAAVAILFFGAGFAVFRVSSANAVGAAPMTGAPVAVAPQPTVAIPAAATAPAAAAAPAAPAPPSPLPAVAEPSTPAKAAPRTTPRKVAPRGGARSSSRPAPAPPTDAPPTDGLPIPNDRR